MKRFSNKCVMLSLAGLVLISTSGLAIAQTRAPAQTIQLRQQQLKDLGAAFKDVNDQIRSPNPDLATIRAAVPIVQKAAAGIPTWFPAGTGPEAGVKTAAKPEIWANRAVFDEKARAFQAAAQGFAKASAGSDVAAIGESVRAVGMSCQGCHRDFRVRQP